MLPIYVDGAWADARTASAHEIKNPATLQVLDTVPDCGAEDVERAVGAATAAQPAWGDRPPAERVALLREMAQRLRAQQTLLALSLSRESGKPLCEARDCIAAAANMFERCGDTERGGPDASPPAPGTATRHAGVADHVIEH